MLDRHRYKNTESILNEWNYLRGWTNNLYAKYEVGSYEDQNLRHNELTIDPYTKQATEEALYERYDRQRSNAPQLSHYIAEEKLYGDNQ